jgi:hypothetical protein
VNILNEVDHILHVPSGGGLGYIPSAFFLWGC